jgi:hypothetical protein
MNVNGRHSPNPRHRALDIEAVLGFCADPNRSTVPAVGRYEECAISGMARGVTIAW